MSERQDATLLLFGVAHYREIASKLRVVARGCNFPNVRKDLIDLAARYDRRADHFDRPRGGPIRGAFYVIPGLYGTVSGLSIGTRLSGSG